MPALIRRHGQAAILAAMAFLLEPAAGNAQQAQPSGLTSGPVQMVRSLQFVQDSIVKGDHSAMEMQRHLLGLIDRRLRDSDISAFDDPANVNAALIYAMSGGNPATLGVLVARDHDDRFDDELIMVLDAYLTGQGGGVRDLVEDVLTEYRDTPIGPYLMLVAGTILADPQPEQALEKFDLVRLMAPGTIMEEAALRRSIAIAAELQLNGDAFAYAERYARRFLHSPYAGQFATLFVDLVMQAPDAVEDEEIVVILAHMDADRQREIFLRIARRAGIAGQVELASLAAARAAELSQGDKVVRSLADLYSGLAVLPSSDVESIAATMASIDDADLSPSDRALRAAATRMADAVTRQPDPLAFEVTDAPEITGTEPAEMSGEAATPIDDFIQSRRGVLEAVDGILEEGR